MDDEQTFLLELLIGTIIVVVHSSYTAQNSTANLPPAGQQVDQTWKIKDEETLYPTGTEMESHEK